MDFKNRHPLNAIDGYESLSMLEALIPFVEYQLKLPLALFIKFNEIRLILKCFQNTNNLIRLGLHQSTSDPWDMICALTGMSPELVKMMMSMADNGNGNSMFSDLFNTDVSTDNITNMMNMFQSKPSDSNNESRHHPSDYFNHNQEPVSDDFEESIHKLLAEYDLSQANDSSYL